MKRTEHLKKPGNRYCCETKCERHLREGWEARERQAGSPRPVRGSLVSAPFPEAVAQCLEHRGMWPGQPRRAQTATGILWTM